MREKIRNCIYIQVIIYLFMMNHVSEADASKDYSL